MCVRECERWSELASYNQVGLQRSAPDTYVVRVSVCVLVCVRQRERGHLCVIEKVSVSVCVCERESVCV